MKEQKGFRKGRSFTDNTFITTEKHREFSKETQVAFVVFEKTFERADRNLLWQVLEEWRYPQYLKRTIQDLYNVDSLADRDRRASVSNNANTHTSSLLSVHLVTARGHAD